MNDVTENNFNNYGKQDPRIDTYLKEFEEDKSSKIKSRMKKNRQNLPIFSERQKILELIRKNPVVMIKGETGCGKTTQVAQYILEDCIERDEGSICKIVCTQPRRISAMGVANRVAEERGERIGNDSRQVKCFLISPKKIQTAFILR
jgi:HrpA-like RNA helicase